MAAEKKTSKPRLTRYRVLRGEWYPGEDSGVSDDKYYKEGEIVKVKKSSEAVKWALEHKFIEAV